MGKCKYYNCTHTHEPGCAIEAAFEEGKITESRYKSYLSMLEDEDNRR
jgi:ribosome biogenesis GTPase / thiamine phosphate phosphatase